MGHQSTDVEVVEGNSAVISCCWKANITNSSVAWSKDGAQLKNIIYDAAWSSPNTDRICANLTLPNVTRNHSGRYFCKVTIDIPTLKVFEGNGTTITVTERQNRLNDTMGKSMFFCPQVLLCFTSKQKIDRYQSLVVHSNVGQDRLGIRGVPKGTGFDPLTYRYPLARSSP